ncbi:hypothetical protein CPB84DRAFT_1777700 [Gymnopilus junonius]|uniref:Uncharacterized protein n=1 Tax=Gymnopilus junonius TaxID=109634 RepID=A0A9P5NLK0_GYMJU|nr:hypothetical protein CPB84DRAFT_1777700 [Gymnopilus junonius]
MMSNSGIAIELYDHRHFVESEWIGIGKQYPKDPPVYIEDAKKQVLEIPDQFEKHFPDFSLPVLQFLAANLPSISGELLAIKPEQFQIRIFFNFSTAPLVKLGLMA